MIKANCRDRFTAADFEFVVQTLSKTQRDAISLVQLLTDEETRDSLLDHPVLVQAILEMSAALRISPQLYFYVLTRHVLKTTGLHDRATSDYIASLLEWFSYTARMRSPADGRDGPIQYLSDMLTALRDASPAQSFLIRAHVGNYSLFISGIFHETVECRRQRGGPGVAFYEDMGRTSFKAIAGHQTARSAALTSVYEQLAHGFHEARIALNRLSETMLHFETSPAAHLFHL